MKHGATRLPALPLAKLLSIAAVLVLFAATAVGQGALVTFDAPDAGKAINQGTAPTSINSKSVIAGYYIDSSNLLHGFLRQPNGAITEFSPPNMSGVFVLGINTSGQVIGSGTHKVGSTFVTDGFLRSPGGHYTLIDAPCAIYTQPLQINDNGMIAGYFQGSDGMHGFLRDASGNYTVIDDPDAQVGGGSGEGTWVLAINANGAATGYYSDTHTAGIRAFVRDQFGTYTNFDAISGPIQAIVPNAINQSGEIAGYYADFDYTIHSFLRNASGTVTTFDYPNGTFTQSFGMNDGGVIVGYYYNTVGKLKGFRRDASGNFITISDPTSKLGTQPAAINNAGRITGMYMDANSTVHGFVK